MIEMGRGDWKRGPSEKISTLGGAGEFKKKSVTKENLKKMYIQRLLIDIFKIKKASQKTQQEKQKEGEREGRRREEGVREGYMVREGDKGKEGCRQPADKEQRHSERES